MSKTTLLAVVMLLVSATLVLLSQPPAHAHCHQDGAGTVTATLDWASAECVDSDEPSPTAADVNSGADGPSYEVRPVSECDPNYGPVTSPTGGLNPGGGQGSVPCGDAIICSPGSPPGIWHELYVEDDYHGLVCIEPTSGPSARPLPSTEQIHTAFAELTWPAPELSIQPPGGRTLVNFETIFSTDLIEPVTQTVTLLGHEITITATPVSYTWHAGDGTTWTTEDPGAPWTRGANAAELNHHVYGDAHETFSAYAEVTYEGRYRIGNRSEQAIPGTHTVTGPTTGIEVGEATPVLVGSH